ncbi:cell division protein SepF [Mycoplasma yeatsii]|uniref:Cell division inhibitor SepF n=1 Tax=Mycoplasma yeatsii TaxID=51365 RepID=A0ABU0NF49_9MOLU|nr:cell division protein SepF [Mycoplasma yeatsii]MDQ0568075.1 cell division inhibitor SepF [Mycoplasma yeatsii]
MWFKKKKNQKVEVTTNIEFPTSSFDQNFYESDNNSKENQQLKFTVFDSNQNYENENHDNKAKSINQADSNLTSFQKISAKTNVIAPSSFSEVQKITDRLLKEKVVFVDLKKLDLEDKKRFKNFIAGVLYVKNGEYTRLHEMIYKFTIKN